MFHFIIFRSKTWTTSRCSLTSPLFLISFPQVFPTSRNVPNSLHGFPHIFPLFFPMSVFHLFPMFSMVCPMFSMVFPWFSHVFPWFSPRFPHVFPPGRPGRARPPGLAQRPSARCRTSWPSISTPRSSWPWRQLRPCRRCHRRPGEPSTFGDFNGC